MPGETAKDNGTSPALTEATAAAAFESLLSAEEAEHEDGTEAIDEPTEEVDPSDSPEDEESEEGAEPEGEGEDDGEPAPEPRKLKVKLADGEQELPEDEVVKGYLRTADYTRKTQALAEERKKQQAEFDGVRAERQEYAKGIAQVHDALKAITPQEPDWAKLREESPEQFATTWAEWDRHQKQLKMVADERERADSRVQHDRIVAHAETIKGEKELLDAAIPEWKDAAVAKKEQAEIRKFGQGLGFTDDQLNAVYDHRLVLLLRKGMLYDAAQAGKPTVQKKIERVTVKPGAKKEVPAKQATELTRAKQRLAKTGRVTDAARAIELMLD